MTNSEKYLKDGVDVEFVDEFEKFCAKQTGNQASSVRLIQFLSRAVIPTLTEDERVILRNMQPEKTKKVTAFKIKRDKDGDLWLFTKGTLTNVTYQGNEVTGETNTSISFYNHLFQFIKERRRILY